jgi:hypothetical protein
MDTKKKGNIYMSEFQYILDKISNSAFMDYPFKHLEIKNFLREDHLQIILNDDQVHFNKCDNVSEMLEQLRTREYNIIDFPGCTTNLDAYLKNVDIDSVFAHHSKTLEGYGIAFELSKYRNDTIRMLIKFLNSDDFKSTLVSKFEINSKIDSKISTTIMKYLSGYEISPHPDIRRKCMTYLLNINNVEASNLSIHTYLLKFKKEYEYVKEYWNNNLDVERCWVPWDWCEISKSISDNNSIVIFAPSNDTLHAVKLKYAHEHFQRTQIYGNINYVNKDYKKVEHDELYYLCNNPDVSAAIKKGQFKNGYDHYIKHGHKEHRKYLYE